MLDRIAIPSGDTGLKMADAQRIHTFFGKMARDTRANVMAIGAAAVLPMIGMIGGGVDLSRAYLAKSRLQQACDAGALAARKKLGGGVIIGSSIPTEIRDTAHNFFDANFEDGIYGTDARSFELTVDGDTRMRGAASVSVPTTLMSIFGFENIDVNVACSAEMNLPNIDVMMVLDTSGSMSSNSGDGTTRIDGLKNAVFAFYDEVMAVVPDGARIRIGFVPYNAGVNVGASLMAKNPDYIANSWKYQTRRAVTKPVSNNDAVNEGDVISQGSFRGPVPRDPNDFQPKSGVNYRWNVKEKNVDGICDDYDDTYIVNGFTYVTTNDDWNPNYYSGGSKDTRGACVMNVTYTKRAGPGDVRPETFRDVFDHYVYDEMEMPTNVYKTFATVITQTGTNGANVSSSWNGCIEERQMMPDLDFNPIPDAALDLDIDLIPDAANRNTQWYPVWPAIQYDRGGPAPRITTSRLSGKSANCPRSALKLMEFPLSGGSRNSTFESYVNSLNPSGNTMHDVGMIWGARFLSTKGIFGDENQTAPNGDPISRHILFMTDGEMFPSDAVTTTYGNFDMDGRANGFAPDGTWSTNQLAAIHNMRLAALCQRVQNQNVTVWVVSFGLPLNTVTRGCASGGSRAFEAADSDALVDAFRTIASSIAELRLVD